MKTINRRRSLVEQGHRAQQASNNILTAITAVTALVGLLLVIRAGTRDSVLLLGASLVFASMPVTGIPFWWWRDPLVYRTLSAAGNPRLSSLSAIVEATGLRLTVAPAVPRAQRTGRARERDRVPA